MKDIITSSSIYNGFLLATEQIMLNKDYLNEVNYFPVPDNDTGENLSHLMQRIREEIREEENIKDILKSVSNAAIKGSRGNSGAIFSQFFQGFEYKCPDTTSLHLSELINCFESGSEYAYDSLENPVEGTILTAISDFSASLQLFKNNEIGTGSIFEKSYEELQKTVEKTKYQMKTKVGSQKVDAGALGFMYFVEGFISGIKGKKANKTNNDYIEIIRETHIKTHDYHIVDNYKYCTEILLKNKKSVQKEDFKDILKKYGDSIVITENKTYRRTHIHTNDPQKLIDIFREFGDIVEVKADDMILQQRLTKVSDSEIGIVIDSIADLPLDDLPDFAYMLPLNMIIDGVSYQDKRTAPKNISNIKSATSSQPNIEEIKKFLNPIIKRHKHTIVLTVSSKMSGLFERYLEYNKSNPNISLEIVDTKLNSVAEGLVVYHAIKKIQEGIKYSELIKFLESSIKRTKIFVSLKNLDGMVKSGRLNQRIGWFLQKIGFLPLVSIDQEGNGIIKRAAFSNKRNYSNLLKEIKINKDKIESYALVHVNNLEKIRELEKVLIEILGFSPLYISEISSITENFSGDGSVAIGYQLKENYE